MERTRHRNTAMSLAAVLFCLVMASMFFVNNMYARFSVSAEGDGSARVASFKVTGTGFSQTINFGVKMKPGDPECTSLKKNILIKNEGETSVECTVIIRNTTRNLPLELKVYSEESSSSSALFNSAEGYSFTKELDPGSTPMNFEFQISWPSDKNYIAYSGMLDNIAVSVSATQID